MTKTEIIGALKNIKNNHLFSLLATRIIKDDDWRKLIGKTAQFKRSDGSIMDVQLDDYASIMLNPSPDGRKLLISEVESSVMRSLLRETHEALLWYCQETKQFEEYKKQPWFHFMRIMRNVSSHKDGGKLRKWPHDLTKKSITSVTWKSRTIDKSMVGSDLSFSVPDALDAWDEMFQFVENILK
jgi:hypothetical protein